MGQKGSKYARKHQETSPKTNEQKSAEHIQAIKDKLSEDNQIIFSILSEPYNFEKSFLNLPYQQQILMVVTLDEIIKYQEKNSLRGLAAEIADMAQIHLNKIHMMTDSYIDNGNFEPLSDDEKRIIRMDCYGKINKRPDHQLSPIYKFFKQPQNAVKAKFTDYDLDNSPSWRVFKQFESFRSIEFKIKCYLYRQNINPDALKALTVNDYCDVIYNAFVKKSSNVTANFISPEKNIRIRLIKSFMRHCGKQFEQQLISKGNDPRCAASLCNAMRRFGHTDIDTLSITETHYTPRILADLAKAGYDVSEIKSGDRISPAFVNLLIDENKESLILARTENGQLLSKQSLPHIEVHHKHAVQFTSSNGYLAKANYPRNLMLVDSLMHKNYYHLFDCVYKQNQMNNFYSRLNANNPYMISILGFNEQDCNYFDFENTPAFKKREAEDKKYVVNYLQEMEKRLRNEINLVEQYRIPYNCNTLLRNNRGISYLTQNLSKDSENMQRFSSWMKTQRKNEKGGR